MNMFSETTTLNIHGLKFKSAHFEHGVTLLYKKYQQVLHSFNAASSHLKNE